MCSIVSYYILSYPASCSQSNLSINLKMMIYSQNGKKKMMYVNDDAWQKCKYILTHEYCDN